VAQVAQAALQALAQAPLCEMVVPVVMVTLLVAQMPVAAVVARPVTTTLVLSVLTVLAVSVALAAKVTVQPVATVVRLERQVLRALNLTVSWVLVAVVVVAVALVTVVPVASMVRVAVVLAKMAVLAARLALVSRVLSLSPIRRPPRRILLLYPLQEDGALIWSSLGAKVWLVTNHASKPVYPVSDLGTTYPG
jgi:hypothetical protein